MKSLETTSPMYVIIYCHHGGPGNAIEISRDFEIMQF
jgi:hypothetical protein